MRQLAATALALLLASANAVDTESEAIEYLTKFGYIKTENGSKPFVDVTTLNDAVKKFQDFAGLEKTGNLDKETQELMQTPRCGVEDKIANFVLHGSKWPKKDLTYHISQYPRSSLNKQDVDSNWAVRNHVLLKL